MELLDDDAYVVGLSYFPPSVAPNLSVAVVHAMALTAGVKLPKRRQNLKALLISFGHELHCCGKVKLRK